MADLDNSARDYPARDYPARDFPARDYPARDYPALDYTAHLRADSARFRDVLATADPDAPVPGCPGWKAADLLWHLADVQRFWATIVRERLAQPDAAGEESPRPAGIGYDEVLARFDRASADLQQALAGAGDDVRVWTWFDADQSVGFIRRRQAHEALIHRWDAEGAARAYSDMDPVLASDGVSEVFQWMYSAPPAWSTCSAGGPIGAVRALDTGASWLVQLGSWSGTSPNTGNTYADEGLLSVVDTGEASFTLSGAARDLDAWLWNRPTLAAVDLDGDYARFAALIRSGVQ